MNRAVTFVTTDCAWCYEMCRLHDKALQELSGSDPRMRREDRDVNASVSVPDSGIGTSGCGETEPAFEQKRT